MVLLCCFFFRCFAALILIFIFLRLYRNRIIIFFLFFGYNSKNPSLIQLFRFFLHRLQRLEHQSNDQCIYLNYRRFYRQQRLNSELRACMFHLLHCWWSQQLWCWQLSREDIHWSCASLQSQSNFLLHENWWLEWWVSDCNSRYNFSADFSFFHLIQRFKCHETLWNSLLHRSYPSSRFII